MKMRIVWSGLAACAVVLATGTGMSGPTPMATSDNELVDFDPATSQLSAYPAGGALTTYLHQPTTVHLPGNLFGYAHPIRAAAWPSVEPDGRIRHQQQAGRPEHVRIRRPARAHVGPAVPRDRHEPDDGSAAAHRLHHAHRKLTRACGSATRAPSPSRPWRAAGCRPRSCGSWLRAGDRTATPRRPKGSSRGRRSTPAPGLARRGVHQAGADRPLLDRRPGIRRSARRSRSGRTSRPLALAAAGASLQDRRAARRRRRGPRDERARPDHRPHRRGQDAQARPRVGGEHGAPLHRRGARHRAARAPEHRPRLRHGLAAGRPALLHDADRQAAVAARRPRAPRAQGPVAARPAARRVPSGDARARLRPRARHPAQRRQAGERAPRRLRRGLPRGLGPREGMRDVPLEIPSRPGGRGGGRAEQRDVVADERHARVHRPRGAAPRDGPSTSGPTSSPSASCSTSCSRGPSRSTWAAARAR